MIERIQSRRDALAAQLEQARVQYDQLEAALRQLDRQLCAMQGGLQELDALLVAGAAREVGGAVSLPDHTEVDRMRAEHGDNEAGSDASE